MAVRLTSKRVWMLCLIVVAILVLMLLRAISPSRGGDKLAGPPPGEYTLFGQEQQVTIRGYDGDAMESFISKDGRFLLFNNNNEKPANTNLHYALRVDDLTFDYKGELIGVNTAALEGVPSLDRKGTLYFVSNRSYDTTHSTLYRGHFSDGVVTDVQLVPGVSRQEPGIVNFDAEISGDGQTLYFVDGDFRTKSPPKTADIVIATVQGDSFARLLRSAELLARVNLAGALQYAPCISEDGLELFFTRVDRRDAHPMPQIFRAARTTMDEPFDSPQRVKSIDGFVEGPTLSADGHLLYYHKRDKDRLVICVVKR
jgi:hypothetical protein